MPQQDRKRPPSPFGDGVFYFSRRFWPVPDHRLKGISEFAEFRSILHSIQDTMEPGKRGASMTYISPIIRSEFNMLSADLQREIWARNLCLYNFQDLAAALQSIAKGSGAISDSLSV